MNFVVIGATGMVGSLVTREAAARDHAVTAISRSGAAHPWPTGVEDVAASALDRTALGAHLGTADAVVLAIRPGPGDGESALTATATVLAASAAAGVRVLVVGGAGPLRTPADPTLRLIDDPAFVPEEWRSIAAFSVDQLEVCRAETGADWGYLSPPALLLPGERTGRYRKGSDTALLAAEGSCRISVEDLAVAVVDELEAGRSAARHITVAY